MRENVKQLVNSSSLAPDYESLQNAFAVFNKASEQLSGVYQDLQQQVVCLTEELALANGELQRQLAEKEDLSGRLSLLLTALPAGVIVLDVQGRIEQANPAAIDMFGEPLLDLFWSDVVTNRFAETTAVHEWCLAHHDTRADRRIRIESSEIAATGKQILLIHDITKAHEMQEKAKRNQRLTVMGEMAANLAHQLRTPLSTALIYASHLGNEALPAQERNQFATKTIERLRHLEHLINGMLRFVKGETAQLQKVSTATLLAELRHVIEPQIAAKKMQFILHDHSADSYLMADHKALSGALINLLENAMQVSGTGDRIILSCDTDNDAVIFRVSDDGPGIDAAMQDRLFEPFFTTRADGTGLGLAIVRDVIQSMGGNVQVNSTANAGSEFLVILPRLLPEKEI